MCAMEEQPILTFDTSAINWLADDASFESLMVEISSCFWVQFSFESVKEIVANSNTTRRCQLLDVCKALLQHGGCIDSAGVMLQKMVSRFESGTQFNWTEVDVGVPEASEKMSQVGDFSDGLAKQVQGERTKNEKFFDEVYKEAKPCFDKVLTTQGTKAPNSPAELVSRTPVTFWKTARNIYARYAKKTFDEATIQRFMEECDPFRALANAFFVAAFDKCVRPPRSATSFRPDPGDTLMSVCLPYCDHFVTNDTRAGGQLAFYQEVCSLAGLKHLAVQPYDEFREDCIGPRERRAAGQGVTTAAAAASSFAILKN